jgi:hypothetical protein
MVLGADGVYEGRTELLPLVLFTSTSETEKAEPLVGIPPISAMVAGAGFEPTTFGL